MRLHIFFQENIATVKIIFSWGGCGSDTIYLLYFTQTIYQMKNIWNHRADCYCNYLYTHKWTDCKGAQNNGAYDNSYRHAGKYCSSAII